MCDLCWLVFSEQCVICVGLLGASKSAVRVGLVGASSVRSALACLERAVCDLYWLAWNEQCVIRVGLLGASCV